MIPDARKDGPPPAIDPDRHRRVRRFFAGVIWHLIFWDVLLNRPPLRHLRPSTDDRWRRLARRYRSLALEMGGVLIKLGQFLSIRVDILPASVTAELAGLQDAVPPAPTDAVLARIQADMGRPAAELFAHFSTTPLGSASLAQVHAVRLITGEQMVVKVLRPGIETLVETDLSAIRLVCRWLKLYRPIRHRVDLDWLADEFSTVTRRELDLLAEADAIRRFAADFADEPGVLVPRPHAPLCGPRTLTMENVAYIRIADIPALRAAGIDPAEVAARLQDIYMRQVFETHFVHVDPHPGNLFVRPMPAPAEVADGVSAFPPGDPVPHPPGRPFQLVLVDFGMAVAIPHRLRSAIREYAIGVGLKDARRIVKALVSAGTLLEETDLDRLEAAHAEIFARFWGTPVGRMKDQALAEAHHFLRRYRDVIYAAPFQFQADMLFVVRAIGILSGMATSLDPDFDPWERITPHAERYAREELRQRRSQWRETAVSEGLAALGLPGRLDQVLQKAESGRLGVQINFTPKAQRSIGDLERAVRRLGWLTLTAGLIVAAALLWATENGGWPLYAAALLTLIKAIAT